MARHANTALLPTQRTATQSGAMVRAAAGWYWKDRDGGNLYGEKNLACSEKCMSALAKDTNLRGVWKPCAA